LAVIWCHVQPSEGLERLGLGVGASGESSCSIPGIQSGSGLVWGSVVGGVELQWGLGGVSRGGSHAWAFV
jgi:hypothetical protein